MRTTRSPGNPSEKRAMLASCATLVFQLLRMFWVTELILLMVVLYGLHVGWSEPRQWSDAFFYAAVAQIFIAPVSISGGTEDILAASTVRFIPKGDISETLHQLDENALGKMSFALRMFLGSLLTLLVAVLALRL
jgi:hypothetical protein